MSGIVKSLITLGSSLLFVIIVAYSVNAQEYIGSKACSQCHEEKFNSFMTHSKKAKSWRSIAVMKSKLKPNELNQCYECHTTGHGKPGGFVSIETTPDLAQVGCETCHGPGGAHAVAGDPKEIRRKPELVVCQSCHNQQRVSDFRFKPLIYSGAH
jgi:hypothetical protein